MGFPVGFHFDVQLDGPLVLCLARLFGILGIDLEDRNRGRDAAAYSEYSAAHSAAGARTNTGAGAGADAASRARANSAAGSGTPTGVSPADCNSHLKAARIVPER